MGDVTHIYDTNGALKAHYIYDAWGNHRIYDVNGDEVTKSMSDHIGNINPIRYRGYYYDIETELYYLEARYYDPDTGRFISQDNIDFIVPNHLTGLNLYAYCNNNPIMYTDSSGCWAGIDDLIALVGGAVVGVAGQFVSDIITSIAERQWTFSSWQTYVGAAIGGAAGGMTLLYTANPIAAGAVSGGDTTLFGLGLEKLTIDDYDKSWLEIGINSAVDASIGGLFGMIPGINKITKGRNSWSAVYKSGLTKLGNHTAKHMSIKVFSKGIGANFVSSWAMDAYYGIKQFSYNRIKNIVV